MARKGIILAGGHGTRLAPLTHAVSKQFLPVYDKPMIHYPLATLMLAGLREILVISTPRDLPVMRDLLGDGRTLGITLHYAEQSAPRGLPEALLIGERFLDGAASALILGDNLFYGAQLAPALREAHGRRNGATIFACAVPDPERYAVVAYDGRGVVTDLVEKPRIPPSRLAIPGLYFYDSGAVALARRLRPSARGELEITDLNRLYLERGRLTVHTLDPSFVWLDMGTPDSLLAAGNLIQAVERRGGARVGCIEEIAWRKGWIDGRQLQAHAIRLRGTAYGADLVRLGSASNAGGAPSMRLPVAG